MEPFDEHLIQRIDEYIEDLFAPADAVLEQNLADASAAGLPAINVSPNQGRLLYLLARMVGARRILEIGTLGGYSTTWLARALPPDGRVISLEVSTAHAEVARRSLARAGLIGIVEVKTGDAVSSLQQMIAAGAQPFDVIFIDADKTGYMKYLELSLELAHSGSLILADNIIRNGRVLDPPPDDANACAVRDYNLAIASHPRLESLVLPLFRDKVDGLAISRVK
jgi:predicted O-methyltransferase YrrM